MGNAISNAASSFATVVGNTLVAPFKSAFTKSCENLCSGTWDLFCFIEHFCISDLIKLLLISGISYIALLFLYMLFKLGICQCIVKSLLKMFWAACESYWFMLEDLVCFCWHKISSSKRLYRDCRGRQFRDVEIGYSSSDDSSCGTNLHNSAVSRKRKSSSLRNGKMNRVITPSSRMLRKGSRWIPGHLGRSRLRRNSSQLRGSSRRSSRQLQGRNLSRWRRKRAIFKRRQLS